MLTYKTAGESHGPGLLAFIEGLPYGLPIDLDFVNAELRRRQGGYGRGPRMKMETDTALAYAGMRRGATLGSPLVLRIDNRVANTESLPSIPKPRPGHADLAGAMKYGIPDARDISERASARETVTRVAAGAVAQLLLREFGIDVVGWVVSVGGIRPDAPTPDDPAEIRRRREASEFYVLDAGHEEKLRAKVDEAREKGDTLGGVFEVRAFGLPPGLGSHMQWDAKLDGRLARALMSVQTIKAVEVGVGFDAANRFGSEMHDEILAVGPDGVRRGSNNAGGIEGGTTNGQPVVVRAAAKPISTLRKGLKTVNLPDGAPAQAAYERSDVCVVPAASVIGEAVVAFELAQAFLEKFGGDSMAEVRRNHDAYRKAVREMFLDRKPGT